MKTRIPDPGSFRRGIWSLIFLAAVCAGVTWLVLPGTKVMRPNFDRISVGLSRKDVEQIFGRPPDSTTTLKGHVESPILFVTRPGETHVPKYYRDYTHTQWYSADEIFVVIFDDETAVCRYSGPYSQPSWWDRLLTRAKSWIR